MAAPAANLLAFVQTQTRRAIEMLRFCLDEIGGTRDQAYKVLEVMIAKPAEIYIPDRVWRCILESAGRALRQQADRKRIFDLLRPLMSESILESDNALRAVVDAFLRWRKKASRDSWAKLVYPAEREPRKEKSFVLCKRKGHVRFKPRCYSWLV